MCRVPRCAGFAEIFHHPMKHGLTRRVVDSPYSTFHRLVAEGVDPEGRAGRDAAQYASLLRPTCSLKTAQVRRAHHSKPVSLMVRAAHPANLGK